jgi:chromosome segregation ATPase
MEQENKGPKVHCSCDQPNCDVRSLTFQLDIERQHCVEALNQRDDWRLRAGTAEAENARLRVELKNRKLFYETNEESLRGMLTKTNEELGALRAEVRQANEAYEALGIAAAELEMEKASLRAEVERLTRDNAILRGLEGK